MVQHLTPTSSLKIWGDKISLASHEKDFDGWCHEWCEDESQAKQRFHAIPPRSRYIRLKAVCRRLPHTLPKGYLNHGYIGKASQRPSPHISINTSLYLFDKELSNRRSQWVAWGQQNSPNHGQKHPSSNLQHCLELLAGTYQSICIFQIPAKPPTAASSSSSKPYSPPAPSNHAASAISSAPI